MIDHPKYPRELTEFKTSNYNPGNHYTVPKKWDNFTMHVPLWNQVLTHFFKDKENLKFLELGTGNGLCANYLLDNYSCHVDTVDLEESRIVLKDEVKYKVSILNNLQPFIDQSRCEFYCCTTQNFFKNNIDKIYDFIYLDAGHDKDWVLHDAIKSFDLLKEGGLMIFDDYGWGDCKEGIESFLNCYSKHIEVFHKEWQVMLLKKSNLKIESYH